MEIKELISKNNLQLRTQEEIKTKFEQAQKESGMFNFKPEVLIEYLTFENAKLLIKKYG